MMSYLFALVPAMIAAWLAGSISSAVLVCRLMNLPDPRQHGSGNPGATNVLRTAGPHTTKAKVAALLTLLGDAGKGWLSVMLAACFFTSSPVLALVGFAAFLGHLYPAFFQLKGGKGVATAAGALLALSLPLGLALVVTWLLVALLFRYASLAAIVTAILAPFYGVCLAGFQAALVIAAMSALLIWRHRQNLRQLANGTEKRIGQGEGNSPSRQRG